MCKLATVAQKALQKVLDAAEEDGLPLADVPARTGFSSRPPG